MRSASHAARLGFLIVALSLAGCSGGANVNPTPQGLSQSQTQATALQNMPTSKDQCKDGSWQTFGVFKNQGDCVSYVATHGKNPPDVTPSPAPTPTTTPTPTPIGSFVEFAYVANSGSGNVSAYTIDATNGALTPAAGSPFGAGSGPHGVAVDPTGKVRLCDQPKRQQCFRLHHRHGQRRADAVGGVAVWGEQQSLWHSRDASKCIDQRQWSGSSPANALATARNVGT